MILSSTVLALRFFFVRCQEATRLHQTTVVTIRRFGSVKTAPFFGTKVKKGPGLISSSTFPMANKNLLFFKDKQAIFVEWPDRSKSCFFDSWKDSPYNTCDWSYYVRKVKTESCLFGRQLPHFHTLISWPCDFEDSGFWIAPHLVGKLHHPWRPFARFPHTKG